MSVTPQKRFAGSLELGINSAISYEKKNTISSEITNISNPALAYSRMDIPISSVVFGEDASFEQQEEDVQKHLEQLQYLQKWVWQFASLQSEYKEIYRKSICEYEELLKKGDCLREENLKLKKEYEWKKKKQTKLNKMIETLRAEEEKKIESEIFNSKSNILILEAEIQNIRQIIQIEQEQKCKLEQRKKIIDKKNQNIKFRNQPYNHYQNQYFQHSFNPYQQPHPPVDINDSNTNRVLINGSSQYNSQESPGGYNTPAFQSNIYHNSGHQKQTLFDNPEFHRKFTGQFLNPEQINYQNAFLQVISENQFQPRSSTPNFNSQESSTQKESLINGSFKKYQGNEITNSQIRRTNEGRGANGIKVINSIDLDDSQFSSSPTQKAQLSQQKKKPNRNSLPENLYSIQQSKVIVDIQESKRTTPNRNSPERRKNNLQLIRESTVKVQTYTQSEEKSGDTSMVEQNESRHRSRSRSPTIQKQSFQKQLDSYSSEEPFAKIPPPPKLQPDYQMKKITEQQEVNQSIRSIKEQSFVLKDQSKAPKQKNTLSFTDLTGSNKKELNKGQYITPSSTPRKDTDEDEDDDDFQSINLLAVSRISKQKESSLKNLSGLSQNTDQVRGGSKISKSHILKNMKKQFATIEQEKDKNQDASKKRLRKTSGSRFSNLEEPTN